MPKAYVTSKGNHNYSPLFELEFIDEVVYMTDGSLSQYRTGYLTRVITDVLTHSKPDDYLVLTGLGVTQAIAAAVFALKHGRLNLLLFSRGRYVPREIMFTEAAEKRRKKEKSNETP